MRAEDIGPTVLIERRIPTCPRDRPCAFFTGDHEACVTQILHPLNCPSERAPFEFRSAAAPCLGIEFKLDERDAPCRERAPHAFQHQRFPPLGIDEHLVNMLEVVLVHEVIDSRHIEPEPRRQTFRL